ncbi:MAG TPA: RNA polymerase sigma-54 factor, partial [Usitatibacteraceae bacterium]|nr:RNA polymerase sigma-54 factor [Usitatibacteraceae bacterium]
MKQSLQLKLSQHLTLTPQLQQSIKLLQLSTVELNQEIDRLLLENPMLEQVDEGGNGSPVPEQDSMPAETAAGGDSPESPSAEFGEGGDWHEAGGSRSSGDDEDRDDSQYPAAEQTLQQYLIDQLMLLPLSEFDRRTAILLIAHINDDGYLPEDLSELAADAAATWGIGNDDLAIARKLIQSLEPTGVGAQSLRECLILQIDALPPATPGRELAKALANQHLDLLANHDFARLRRQLRCSEDELREANSLITSLDPKPGSRIGNPDVRYVVPDVIVKKTNGRWQARLNADVMPRLRVNKLYADLLQRSRDGDGRGLSAQLQEARWLIKNVQQRFDTILRVAQAIVEQQRHFF